MSMNECINSLLGGGLCVLNLGPDTLCSYVTDMKAQTMSLAHGRVMKTTFEPVKGNTDTRPEASVNNQKNHHRSRLVITRPGASVNIQYQELYYSPMGE